MVGRLDSFAPNERSKERFLCEKFVQLPVVCLDSGQDRFLAWLCKGQLQIYIAPNREIRDQRKMAYPGVEVEKEYPLIR